MLHTRHKLSPCIVVNLESLYSSEIDSTITKVRFTSHTTTTFESETNLRFGWTHKQYFIHGIYTFKSSTCRYLNVARYDFISMAKERQLTQKFKPQCWGFFHM